MLLREGRPVSVSSLRAETLDAELLDLLVESGLRRVTLAPESGSQELRRRIGKSLSDQALVQAVRTVAAAGMTGLKLYYLVGLPGEEEADVHRLVAQVLELRAEARTVTEGARLGFTVSVGCFVPKARTPFQWEGIQTRTTLKQRLRIVHRGLGREPEIKVRTERPRDAWLQALLARGGRSWAGPLESADGDWRRLGQDLPPTAWRWVHERMSHHRPLPWDHLEDPKDRRDLSQEHERFLGQIGEVAA